MNELLKLFPENLYAGEGGILLNMDCLDAMKRMPDGCVDLVVTDPPFNVGKDYGKNVNDNRNDYWEWMNDIVCELYRIMSDKSRLYMFNTDNGMFKLRPIMENAGFIWAQMLIWYGPNLVGGPGVRGDWHFMHEPCILVRKGKRTPMLSSATHSNCFSVQVYSRPQRNFKEGRFHIAQKPLKLMLSYISRTPGDIVFEPFAGAGTTLLAAKQLGRKFIGVEIEPKYIEICQQRLAQEVLAL